MTSCKSPYSYPLLSEGGAGLDRQLYALALMSCPNLGTSRLKRALECFGGPVEAVLALSQGEASVISSSRDRIAPSQAKKIARYLKAYDFDSASKALEGLDARVVFCGEPGYPRRLASSPCAPPFLVVAGSSDISEVVGVAIVGTRRASFTGLEVARRFGRGLAECGVTVVSGLAKGIDAAAHAGALEAETNDDTITSVAVLGCGLDVIYPRCNVELYRCLLDRGAVLSQYGLGSPPEKWRFPERNRTIAGMSLGVVVVESFASGGALSTVAAANEIGREVMSVPGSVLNPASEGTNQLIWEGASPVRSAKDVLAHLSGELADVFGMGLERFVYPKDSEQRSSAGQHARLSVLGGVQAELLYLLNDGEARTLAELSKGCRASPSEVVEALACLSEVGLVEPHGGERFVARL